MYLLTEDKYYMPYIYIRYRNKYANKHIHSHVHKFKGKLFKRVVTPLGNTTAQSFSIECPQLDLTAATLKIRTFHIYVCAYAYRRVDFHT